MLLFVALGVGLVISIALTVRFGKTGRHDGAMFIFGAIVIVLFLVLLGLSTITIRDTITKEADEAIARQHYESLYFQAYYSMYENDNDLGKKQLADQITKWNEELEEYRANKKNKWISIMYPMDISDFKIIPVTMLEGTVG